MKCRVISLEEGRLPRPTAATAPGVGVTPTFALGFVPPAADLEERLAAFAEELPGCSVFGCEAVTQFAGGGLEAGGCLQLVWLEEPGSSCRLEVIEAANGGLDAAAIERVTSLVEDVDAALVLADGLRFPSQELLAELRARLSPAAARRVAGGLASQREPIAGPGARVFADGRVYENACLVAGLDGVRIEIEIVRGWDPASPVFTVTSADGNTAWEIDGQRATDWYREIFTLDGELAPMPESAHRFPLIIEGPDPSRHGLYRSMQRFDQESGGVTYWGDVRTGDRVRLGIGNDRSLARAASALGARGEAQAAVLYSCVGREAVLGAQARDEVEAIDRVLGGVPLAGFFTFGEIGPTPPGGLAFYNQTAVLALLREEAR